MTQTPKHPSHTGDSVRRPKWRLHHPSTLAADGVVTLDEAAAHYLGRVLRLKPGAEIGLFNGTDGEWRATLTQIDKRSAQATLLERLRAANPCPPLTLAVPLIRKERLEWLVEKAAELGVTRIQLLQTDYTNAKNIKVDRLERIAAEAAEQCERMDLPQIVDAVLFTDWLATAQHVIAPIERLTAQPLLSVDRSKLTTPTLLVGPEGGFSPAEQTALIDRAAQVSAVTLGARLLRAETAAIAGLSLIQAARGQMDLSPES